MSADPILDRALSRRRFLERSSTGFGMLALAGLTADTSTAGVRRAAEREAARRGAKHVIFCFMSGGVSQVDSFDPKPELERLHGQPMPVAVQRTQFNNNGNVMASPFRFHRHGESGLAVSSMFPHIATVADELAVIRSMTSSVNEHAQGNFLMHTGFPFLGHPSAGSWLHYGLGSASDNLPGFVVLQAGGAVPPHGGVGLFSSGFLPAHHQASILVADRDPAVRNVAPALGPKAQRRQLDLIAELDARFLERSPDRDLEAAIRNDETAFRMQTAVPEVCAIDGETAATRALYGLDDPEPTKAAYARQCLLARRLVERGVRFVELSCITKNIGAGGAANPWDQHGDLERGHGAMAYQVDQPIAGLIKDLRSRGLLEETLIVWAGEFGRTPFSQGSDGRDHNPHGFSVFLAGGGVKGGTVLGATDELGYHAVEDPCDVYDLWATVLHLSGLDHERLTYRYAGRDVRLTDVHGRVLRQIIA
ncbi:MAG: DUF1501 domain-containing protein [Planctomycetes bacterium]|jgi:hypothetical protein|nr:DUF1501 domain-containing protein [Planctomycetota bacterium]